MGAKHRTRLELTEVRRLISQHFPGLDAPGRRTIMESVDLHVARCRLEPGHSSIRPGGTVSGPALFHIADFTIYVALIATLGEPAISAVTSNLNINFLTRPQPKDVLADALLLRIGKRLAYAEVRLVSEGSEELIAHATGTYALPRIP